MFRRAGATVEKGLLLGPAWPISKMKGGIKISLELFFKKIIQWKWFCVVCTDSLGRRHLLSGFICKNKIHKQREQRWRWRWESKLFLGTLLKRTGMKTVLGRRAADQVTAWKKLKTADPVREVMKSHCSCSPTSVWQPDRRAISLSGQTAWEKSRIKRSLSLTGNLAKYGFSVPSCQWICGFGWKTAEMQGRPFNFH